MGTLQAFGIYAVGFISRPLGAAFFGHYGDRIGRKVTLIATLLITGLATFAVGFVPGYASIAHCQLNGPKAPFSGPARLNGAT